MKKFYKRFVAILMVVALCTQLCGCGMISWAMVNNIGVIYELVNSLALYEEYSELDAGGASNITLEDRTEEESTEEEDDDADVDDADDSDVDDSDDDDTDSQTVSGDEVDFRDDFYEYVNGDTLDIVTAMYGDSNVFSWFNELYSEIYYELVDLTEEICSSGEDYEKGSPQQKIRDLYECISDMDSRNATGLGPLQPYMDSIRQSQTIDEYVEAVTALSGEFGFSSIVGGYTIMEDLADTSKYSVYLMYADTLIGKEYVENDAVSDSVETYFEYVEDMFEEFGYTQSEAIASADAIEELLREICASTMDAADSADPSSTYNPMTQQEVQAIYTNVDIGKMFDTLGISGQDYYIIMDVDQAVKVNSLLVEENLEALKEYSTFVMLNDAAEYSTETYAQLKEDVDSAIEGSYSYTGEMLWNTQIQEILEWEYGKLYATEYFTEEDKQYLEFMVYDILNEYENIINEQDWMTDETKAAAIRKLDTMSVKIGYPDEWPESMDMLQITPISEGGSLLSNLLVYYRVVSQERLAQLENDVEDTEWTTTPQTVNAFYSPTSNEIVFPAAILQEPFYSSDWDYATNLGGIGFIIAHEVSHAFDASGRQYDENGNYNLWWTEEELVTYETLSQAIIDYYSQYEVVGMNVDGELTLSENIADLGSMNCITRIIDKKYTDELEKHNAYSDLFVQYAYEWCSYYPEETAKYALITDDHSPDKVRVNAVLSSTDVFYEVCDVQPGDGMYVEPEDRVGIW